MAKRALTLLAFFASLLVATQAFAQEDMLADGVRPTGMGLAYTSVASGSPGLFHNPGGITANVMYQAEGTFEYNPSGSVLTGAVVDSKTNQNVGGGAAYSYFIGRGDLDEVSGHDVRLGVGLPVVPEQVSVGASLRYLHLKDEAAEDEPFMQGFSVDAGVVLRPHELVRFGVAGQNLIDLCEDPDVCAGVMPTKISGGAAVGDEAEYLLSVDGGVDISSDPDGVHPFAEVGGEYFAGGAVPVRAGYQWIPSLDRHVLTGGLGVRVEQAGLDFGFRVDPSDPEYAFFNGSVSVYPF
ncbi:MAG: hypothetical protein ACOCV2_02155 [Persicimonas sp.]